MVLPVLGFCVVGYFAYHAVQGDRGLIAWRQLTHRVNEARAVLGDTSIERRALENRVGLLSPRSLDRDMLDERARFMLNYGYTDEVIIFVEKPREPGPAKGRPRAPGS
ncbi:MAG: septum formation initiator family protein [Rhodospirillales bacterium]|nr:septum formation initiator family protein [Rhodospirillales bacterium]